MIDIKGTIEQIIFRNDDSGYSVFVVSEDDEEKILIGNITNISKGEEIEAKCEEIYSEKYGTQYKIYEYNIYLPETKDNIIRFLSSDDFPGVGEVLAKRLVDTFGDHLFYAIENEDKDLMLIKSMNETKMKTLKNGIVMHKLEAEVTMALRKYDIGIRTIKKLIERYGNRTLEMIFESPYKIARDIDGIGFKICDKIAIDSGIAFNSKERLEACIEYIIKNAESEGDVYIYEDDLIYRLREYIDEDIDIKENLTNLHLESRIKIVEEEDKKKIYEFTNYMIEKDLSRKLYEWKDNIKIITGGPGTGKTYNIKKYIKEAVEKGENIKLAAPTGRAAKRMEEVTGVEAKTIHRLLGFSKNLIEVNGRKTYFAVNELNPIDCNLLIIDEMSMVDMKLMYNLIKGVKEGTKILLVGDVDQLPSVGCGQVLKDMIDSKIFDTMKLTKIYRQEEDSNIIKYSHRVNNGDDIEINNNFEDFKFVRKSKEAGINEALKELVIDILPKHFDIDPYDIQVLCPSKRNESGSENVNKILKDHINKKSGDKNEIKIGNTIYRENDKVMQIKNNYNLKWTIYGEDGIIIKDEGDGVFNGDIGRIEEINEYDETVRILFDDREVIYSKEDMKDLTYGYAITVHKSQGSEYDVVVVTMGNIPRPLLNRKILYTAMTRARKCIIFIGNENVFYTMIHNTYDAVRHSSLMDKNYICDI